MIRSQLSRLFGRRRRPAPLLPRHTFEVYLSPPATTARQVTAEIVSPSQPPKERAPMSPKQRKILRAAAKRQQRTAAQLAQKAGLSASDGSGRGIVRDLHALVERGELVRHEVRSEHYAYTKAA